ncbi:MAG TPA: sigma 54-interacting transcriptional regulator [Symbiobacteriaceae bacterium]|jgi:transcriptional regulator with PAS, ATPase and Fis domain
MPDAEAQIRALEAEVATLQEIIDNAYECVVVVDRDGYITRLNRPYEELLQIPSGSALGRHVTEVIENTRMHIVVKTGVPEIGWAQRINGQDRIVQRTPIVRNGSVVGAVGKFMFKDVEELRALSQRIGLLESKVKFYEQELKQIRGAKFTFDQIVGRSQPLTQAKQLALKAAQNQASILLLGESGTGKELFAHAIHQSSGRAAGPFVKINCAAIPGDLLESELFGYEEGAFTGARKGGKPGKLELAHRGTIFLDEIGDMPMAMQAKILRAVQEREIERVGGVLTLQVDVRIIAATNADLEQRVAEGRFREDLYYRLNVIAVRLPPLRERSEDIPLLVEHGLARLAEEQGMPLRHLSPVLLEEFRRYAWPGNVRELLNLLERLVYIADGPEILPSDLPPAMAHRLQGAPREERAAGTLPNPAATDLDISIARAERAALQQALTAARGGKAEAARILGIHRSTLYDKLHKYGFS